MTDNEIRNQVELVVAETGNADVVIPVEPATSIATATDASRTTKKKTHTPTPVFDAECSKCHKHFKTKSAFEKHVSHQLCYGMHEITFCKTCNITMETHSSYVKHLMTAEHLSSIGVGKLEKLKEEKPGAIHVADPYLSSGEAELLGTRNLGNKYTLVFENEEIQEVKLVRKPTPTIVTPVHHPIPTPTPTPTSNENIGIGNGNGNGNF
jgi:hypothetical protein